MKAWDKLILVLVIAAGLFGAGIEVYLQMIFKSQGLDGDGRSTVQESQYVQ